MSATSSAPLRVALLGYGGLLPFVGLAIGAALLPDWSAFCLRALLSYAATILSFVGALHWGIAMSQPSLVAHHRDTLYTWSVVPALLAWVALLLSPSLGVALLIAGFFAQYLADRRLASRSSLPAWYLPLRLRLTAVACLALLTGMIVAH